MSLFRRRIMNSISISGLMPEIEIPRNIVRYIDSNNIKWERPDTGFEYFWENSNHIYYPDFYLPEYNLIIEYDGKQHFKPMYNDEVKLSKQKARDLLKNKFLEESNYNWMRIHYRINKEEDIISVIEEKIKTISSEASI